MALFEVPFNGDHSKNYVWDSDTLSWVAMTQPLLSTDELTVDVTFPTTQPISAIELPLPEGAATSAKQLGDNHQVQVSNFPASQHVTGSFYQAIQPVSGTVTVANPTNNPETGLATSAKQDILLTELQAKADLTEVQPTADANFEMLLRMLIQGIHNPAHYNSGANALQSLLVTGSTTAVTGTLTAVTTVTGLTNIGGISAASMLENQTQEVWGLNIRSLLS